MMAHDNSNSELRSELSEILFEPSPERIIFLKGLLQKIYPDVSGFWGSSEDVKVAEKNCIEVCEWFGFSPNEAVVLGDSSRKEQEDFWINILLAVQEFEEQREFNSENSEILMFGQLKSLVLRSNVIIELIRFSDILENNQPALGTLTNIIGAARAKVERIGDVLHEIASKDTLLAGLTEQSNHEKRYRDLVIQTFNLVDSFMKLYFVALPKEGCVKIRSTPHRHEYDCATMNNHIGEISRNIHKMIATIKGLKDVFELEIKKIDEVPEFRPAVTLIEKP